jgi:hypothetical protein
MAPRRPGPTDPNGTGFSGRVLKTQPGAPWSRLARTKKSIRSRKSRSWLMRSGKAAWRRTRPALRRVAFDRLLLDELVDLRIAVTVPIAARAAAVKWVKHRVRVGSAGLRVQPDDKILAADFGEVGDGLDDVTSTYRTARCGPACRVVWQGTWKTFLHAPMPIPSWRPD